MSLLQKLHALIDPSLKDTFDKKPYDPAKDRAWLISRLDTTKTQFTATESGRGGGAKWWKLANGVVAFSPVRRDGAGLVINGQTTNFIPSERFLDFIANMREAVEAGEFDGELTSESTAGQTVKVKTPRAPRASSSDGSGWSEERRRKFAETVAARNAAKGTAQ